MADIFFSYKREDRDRIEPIVRLLEFEGFTVWWDPTIVPGELFATVIQKALDEASCVVVGWSANSVGSLWVQDECESRSDTASQKRLNCSVALPEQKYGR